MELSLSLYALIQFMFCPVVVAVVVVAVVVFRLERWLNGRRRLLVAAAVVVEVMFVKRGRLER